METLQETSFLKMGHIVGFGAQFPPRLLRIVSLQYVAKTGSEMYTRNVASAAHQ